MSLRQIPAFAAASLLFLVACTDPPEPPPPPEHPYEVRSCDPTFTFDDGRPHDRVVVAGEFNDWSETADRMAQVEGTTRWELGLPVSPGDYAYKLVVDGAWILDPANGRTLIASGTENSHLVVSDCAAPEIRMDGFQARADGTLTVAARYLDGEGESGPDPTQVRAILDGQPLSDTGFDAETGAWNLALTGLSQGKHALVLEAADATGLLAEPLYLPFWIEPRPFSWDGGLLYFVFTDRFRNGDPANDGPVDGVLTPANFQGGDFQGVIDALEDGYFDDLGVTALWLSPVQENPGGSYPGSDANLYAGYHGYWPNAARRTQPRFGSLEELQALTAAAHARGIRVIADLVFNHVHEDHAYWRDHGDQWFHSEPLICGGDVWNTNPLDCWFDPFLPDFDWEKREVMDVLLDDALWWLQAADLDGFRVDAVKHFNRVAVRNLRGALAEITGRTGVPFYLVGETFTGGGDGELDLINHYIDPTLLDGQFDFPLYWSIVSAFARGESTFRDLDRDVQRAAAKWSDEAIMSPFLGNHDIPRFYSHAAGDIADLWGNGSKEQGWNDPPQRHDWDEPYTRQRLAFAFLLTQPGIPLVYYGDEIALPGAGDPDNRRFMTWDENENRALALREWVGSLGRLRRDSKALQVGAHATLWVEDDLYVYARDAGGDDYAVVAINRGAIGRSVDVEVGGDLAGAPHIGLVDRLGGGQAAVNDGRLGLYLPPQSAAVWTPVP